MNLKSYAIIMGMVLILAVGWPTAASDATEPTLAELQFAGADFPAGSSHQIAITDDGMTIAGTAVTAVYTSPILQAPISFNAMVPSWVADLPPETDMGILVRTGSENGRWHDWVPISGHGDWTLPDDPDVVGEMVTVPASDDRHTQFQFSISFGRYNSLQQPRLTELTFTFIDSTAGPTAAELLAQQRALDAANGSAPDDTFARPTVISREVWCTAVDCDYSEDLEYEPATHMILHHTVSDNESPDWAATVRAIWSYHTYNREWGDIGYNYLIDPDGMIYEGHNNEDYETLDVIGTHGGAANTGSMGVALLGTFTTPEEYSLPGMTPTDEMLAALADLLAWKADQRDIDVYDASRMVNTYWGLPHLMGHRDVYGGLSTVCPGTYAHDLLPWLRDQIASRLAYSSDLIYVYDDGPDFTKSSGSWLEGPRGCGNQGHSYYTWSTSNPAESSFWGEWRPTITETGYYEIEAYAPYCNTGAPETAAARYQVTHGLGTTEVTVSHEDEVGLWISLGVFYLDSEIETVVHLTDLTTDDDLGVWFDDLRLRPVPSATANLLPAPEVWLNSTTVDFNWMIEEPTAVISTAIQVSSNSSMQTPLLAQSWSAPILRHTHPFTEDYASLYWQITAVLSPTVGVNGAGTVTSAVTSFGIDTTVPTATINTLYGLSDDSYLVTWTGSDATSGVASYSLDYRLQGQTEWTRWLTDTTGLAAVFTAPTGEDVYELQVQATDVAGNVQPQSALAKASTEQAVVLSRAIMLPLIRR